MHKKLINFECGKLVQGLCKSWFLYTKNQLEKHTQKLITGFCTFITPLNHSLIHHYLPQKQSVIFNFYTLYTGPIATTNYIKGEL